MAADEFSTEGCYHYIESGLENIYLRNGFRKVERDGSSVVVVDDVDNLHRAIGRRLCKQKFLNGEEFRFLRRELKMSQNRFGAVMGVTENMVSIWERRSAIPKHALAMIKAMYLDYLQDPYRIINLLEPKRTEAANEPLIIEYSDENFSWRLAAGF